MKIRIGDYYLMGDQSQNDFRIAKIGENKKGEETATATMFYPRLDQACLRIMELTAHDSDVKELNELITLLRSTRQLIKKEMLEAL